MWPAFRKIHLTAPCPVPAIRCRSGRDGGGTRRAPVRDRRADLRKVGGEAPVYIVRHRVPVPGGAHET